MKKVLLLDIENVAVKAQELFEFCEKYDKVYVGFAQTPAIFALQDVAPLTKLLNKKLFLVAMQPNKKSDGADFGLAFYAGRLSGKLNPKETEFRIMSSDRDFDHIALLLRNMKFKVKKITKENHQLKKKINDGILPNLADFRDNIYLHDVKKLCDNWQQEKYKNNRPAKIKTLKNHIYQMVKLTDESIDGIIELLRKYQLITLNNTKVSYNQQHIKSWAALSVDEYLPKKSQLKLRQQEMALPPKAEQILADLALKRLKNICEMLFLMEHKPADMAEFVAWLKDEFNIIHEFGVQNVINIMQEYHVARWLGERMIFNDDVIKNWALLDMNSTNDNFVRIENRLLVRANVMRLQEMLERALKDEQKAGQLVDESEYLAQARMVFPQESDELLMKLAIYQKWVVLSDGQVVYGDIING